MKKLWVDYNIRAAQRRAGDSHRTISLDFNHDQHDVDRVTLLTS